MLETFSNAWLLEYLAVDDVLGYRAFGNSKNAAEGASTAVEEAAVCPAKRVCRQDHVVERDERVVLRDRLGVEDIEAGASDSPLHQHSREGSLVDDSDLAQR